jgi:hypothetical protein
MRAHLRTHVGHSEILLLADLLEHALIVRLPVNIYKKRESYRNFLSIAHLLDYCMHLMR